MLTRGEIKGRILRVLMKTPTTPGFYTDDSINDAIQEAIDFVNVEMFTVDEGWTTKLHYFDTTAIVPTLTLPVLPSMAIIKEVRVLFGLLYIPLVYDDANRSIQYSDQSGVGQWGSSYRMIDNQFYFNPPLSIGGANFVQVEYYGYSKRLLSDQDFIESNFDHAMINFIVYRACSVLAARIEKYQVPWAGLENSWFQKMQQIVTKRNSQTTQIREYEGGGGWSY